MKKLLTIFITLILTLFIAQQSFATSTEEEDEANAAAGEMVRIVNYDDLDSDTRNILYDGVKRDDRSNEEHLAFLKSHLYQVDKNGIATGVVVAALSHTTSNVSANHPSAQEYSSGVGEVTVFKRQDVSSGAVALHHVDKGISPVPGTSSVSQPNAVVIAGQAKGYRKREVSSRDLVISNSDKGTSSVKQPSAKQATYATDISSAAVASVNASGVKPKSDASKVTISHFISNTGVKTGVSNKKASALSTGGEGVLIVSVVDAANNSLMQ